VRLTQSVLCECEEPGSGSDGEDYMPKQKQNTPKSMKFKDLLHAIFVKPSPKKRKRAQPLQRTNYEDFRGL
jgi:hypothetical protein